MMMVITVNLNDSQISKLRREAERTDQSISRIVRTAIDEHFNKLSMELVQEDAEGGTYLMMKEGNSHE